MHHDFVGAADLDASTSKLNLNPTIASLNTRPLVVTNGFMRGHGNALFASWIPINNRYVVKLFALLPDLSCVIGSIHQIVTIGNFTAGQLHQRNGNLAVMYGSRRQHCT
jgi:hypothetical protein